jgi:hypothetical protein
MTNKELANEMKAKGYSLTYHPDQTDVDERYVEEYDFIIPAFEYKKAKIKHGRIWILNGPNTIQEYQPDEIPDNECD